MTNKSFKTASKILFCEEEVVRAVAKIESNGGGFNADGTPKPYLKDIGFINSQMENTQVFGNTEVYPTRVGHGFGMENKRQKKRDYHSLVA